MEPERRSEGLGAGQLHFLGEGLRGDMDAVTGQRHRRIARWTLPIWLYVSVTGIVIYLMAFHLYTGS